jgi:hypothetical protein
MYWFRDLRGSQPFGAVDASCNPVTSGSVAQPLDFSLQMSVAVQDVVQYHDINPCSPQSTSAMTAPAEPAPGEHPRISR